MIKCLQCDKTWPEYDRQRVIIHFLDDHQGNLSFLPDDQIKLMLTTIEEKIEPNDHPDRD